MILTISGFVSELMSLYPLAFTPANKETWSDRYISALNSVRGKIDFRRLWQIFEDEYTSGKYPPTPKWIKEAAQKAIIPEGVAFDLENAKMMTFALRGGLYDFVIDKNCEEKIAKMKEQAAFWWDGNINQCPDNLKSKVEELKARSYRSLKR